MKYNRILAFSTDDHLYPAGGAEQAFGNITERLPHITFDLICARIRRKSLPYEEVKNVRIHRIGFGIPKVDGVLLALFGHFYAYRLMKRYSYDLIWSIMASYGAFSAVRIKKRTGLPFLLTLQEGDSFEYIYNRVKFVRKSFNEIFQITDGIQAISSYLLRWGIDMGYAGSQGIVIPNGVSIDAFTQECSKQELNETRKSFGFPSNAFVLITSSRLEKKNGIGDVIAALALLPPEVCFVVCGSGSLEEHIHEQVKKLKLESRVCFMGFVDPKNLPRLLKSSDVFIRPSYTEGLGNAFLEAMAARVITVGTNEGGIPDFLTDHGTGFVVETGKPESIQNVIEKIRSIDSDKRQDILNRAEIMVRERYNWASIAQKMNDLFQSISRCAK